MIESSTFLLVLQFLACIALGALYAWLLYRKESILSVNEKRILALVRGITVASIASLLIFPLVKSVTYTLEKPVIVIAHDNSSSISNKLAADFNYTTYATELQDLSERLASKYEVKTYSFGDSIKSGLHFSGNDLVTDANKLAVQLRTELQNNNVGAVILATDGLFNRGGNPQFELSALNAPVYAIALGASDESRDVSITNLNYNNVAFLGNQFSLEILVQGFKVQGEVVKISVFEEDVLLTEEVIRIDSEDLLKEITLTIPARKLGLRKYSVQLTRLRDELTYKNNNQTFYVEVVEQKQSILIAASVPHPDVSALRNTIQKFHQYEVEVALGDDLEKVNLAKYGVLILHQLPSKKVNAQNFLSRLKVLNTPIWHIVGVDSDLARFNTLQEVVNLSVLNTRNEYVFPVIQSDFSLFQLDESVKADFSTIGPFQSIVSRVSVRQPVYNLLNQKIDNQLTENPLWFFSDFNSTRAAFLLGEGLWNWNLQSDDESHTTQNTDKGLSMLVSNTLQYLSIKGDREKFKVSASKNSYDSFETIVLNATLLNENFEAINTPEVGLELRDEQNKLYNYSFTRTGTAYKLDLGKLSAGVYSFTGAVEFGGKKLVSNGKFYVSESLLEYQQLAANHDLLNTIATTTDGKLIRPAEISGLIAELEKSDSLKTISYEDKRYKEVINYKLLFFLFLLALTLEWGYRKRMGAI